MSEPEWVSIVADNGSVSCKELSQWLGVHEKTIWNWVRRGKLPNPAIRGREFNRGRKSWWRVGTIREWLKANA